MKKSLFFPLLVLVFMVCSMTTTFAQIAVFENDTNCNFQIHYNLSTPSCMAQEAITYTISLSANTSSAIPIPVGKVLSVVSGAPNPALPGCNFSADACNNSSSAMPVPCPGPCGTYKVIAQSDFVKIF